MTERLHTLELSQLGLDEVGLMDGERIAHALNVVDNGEGTYAAAEDVVLLTDSRVIHFNLDGRSRKAAFVSIQDIDAVEVTSERGGYGGYVWGAMAFLVAYMLWRVWDEPMWSVAASMAVALIGVYLIVDQVLTPRKMYATFRAGGTQLHSGISREHETREIYEFVNRLFAMKHQQQPETAPPFAPR